VNARLVTVRLVTVGLLTAAAAFAFSPLFAGSRDLPVLYAAATVPCALAALTPVLRVPAGIRAPLGLVCSSLVVVLTTRPGVEVVDGPLRLLTGALPFDPSGPELAAAALLVCLAATAGAELAVRAREPLWATIPAVLCLTLALAVTASGEQPPDVLPAVLVGGVGALLVAPARARARGADRGPRLAGARAAGRMRSVPRVATAVLLVSVSAVIAWTAGGAAPGATVRGSRFDARDLVAEPVVPKTALSPLAAFADLRAARSELLFTVRSDRPIEQLRVATLTRFDGHLWSATGPYLRAGHTLPHDASRDGAVTRSRLAVEVADEDRATWLPAPGTSGRAVEVSVPGLGVDPATGDLVVPSDRSVPQAYEVASQEPDLSVEVLRAAVAAPTSSSSEAPAPKVTTLDDVHLPAIRAAISEADTSFGEVAALAAYFSRNGGFSRDERKDAASGHGLSQIERLLRTRRGTPEQYASAFAVFARRLGYDARVVVGFQLDRPAAAGQPVEITGAAVHAWPEVRFEELGWVPFDPTPVTVRRRTPPRATAPGAADQVEAAVNQEVTGRERDTAGQQTATPEPDAPRPRTPVWLVALVGAGALAGIAAAGVAGLPVAKAVLRRSRRRNPDPQLRVAGAWDEVVDRLVEHGVAVDPSLTSGELRAASLSRLGPQRTAGLGDLAELADTVRFGAEGANDGEDATAWALCDGLRRSLGAGVPPHRRVRHALDPRPLTRARGAKRP
jgi:transglutaminase-like putative cysteine protease